MKADLSDGRPFSSSKTTNVPFRRIWQQLGQLGAGGAAAEAAATAGGLGAAAGGESVTGGVTASVATKQRRGHRAPCVYIARGASAGAALAEARGLRRAR